MIRAAATALCLAIVAGLAAALGSAYLTPLCASLPASRGYDTAVVLGAGVTAAGRLGPQSRGRATAAADLWRRGIVARLHFTGGEVRAGFAPVGALMREAAVGAGVPLDATSVEGDSQSTLENALLSLPALEGRDPLLLVSSGFHLWRGAASFAWAGRPVAGHCASARFEVDSAQARGRIVLREAAAWWFNIARGAVWRAAAPLGVQSALPEAFLE